MYFFLLVSLFCCEFTNTIIVLFVMTYIWHLYVANKDVFTWSTTSYIKYEFYFINIRQTRVIDPSNIERTSNRCLNSQICFWNICMEKKESKFERSEALSDLSNSDAFFHCDVIHSIKRFVFTEWDSGCIFSWKT